MSSEYATSHRLSADRAVDTPLAAAHHLLDTLMARIGVDGLVAAMRNPGLSAALDQHCAALRDSLAAAGREADAISLASYAASVLSVAKRCGRKPPRRPITDWSTAEWYLVRMLAVCAMAEAAGVL